MHYLIITIYYIICINVFVDTLFRSRVSVAEVPGSKTLRGTRRCIFAPHYKYFFRNFSCQSCREWRGYKSQWTRLACCSPRGSGSGRFTTCKWCVLFFFSPLFSISFFPNIIFCKLARTAPNSQAMNRFFSLLCHVFHSLPAPLIEPHVSKVGNIFIYYFNLNHGFYTKLFLTFFFSFSCFCSCILYSLTKTQTFKNGLTATCSLQFLSPFQVWIKF